MKTYYPLHPLAFQLCFSHYFKAKVKKKRFRGRKIIDNYTHVICSMIFIRHTSYFYNT